VFCKAVYEAGPEMARPGEMLQKSFARSKAIIQKTRFTIRNPDEVNRRLVQLEWLAFIDLHRETQIRIAAAMVGQIGEQLDLFALPIAGALRDEPRFAALVARMQGR
jgi:hypothetical protein